MRQTDCFVVPSLKLLSVSDKAMKGEARTGHRGSILK
jgi:hypothetical protein